MSREPKEDWRETISSALALDQHLRNGLLHGWDRSRTERLCKLLRLTPYELGRATCFFDAPRPGEKPNHNLVERALRDNHFPPVVAMHFALYESWILEELAKRDKKPYTPPQIHPVQMLTRITS